MKAWLCVAASLAAGGFFFAQEPLPRAWIDPATGHRVIRLTGDAGGSTLYFHDNAFSPQGDTLMFNTPGGIAIFDVAKIGDADAALEIVAPPARGGAFARRTREIYFTNGDGAVMAVDIDTRRTRAIPHARGLVNADQTLSVVRNARAIDPDGTHPRPPVRPLVPQLHRMFPGKRMEDLTPDQRYSVTKEDGLAARALNPGLQSFVFTNLGTGELRETGFQYGDLNHLQFNPVDPDLLLYCHEGTWHELDRTWTIRTDGSQMRLMHKRTMDMEINGHEWWSWDGRTVWFDLQTPRSQVFWIAGVNMETGRRTRYRLERDWWGVHFNSSRDDTLFASDGGDASQVAYATDGMWINLLRVQPDETVTRERLVDMSRHNYVTGRGGVEPNVHITPDRKWVVFTGQFAPGQRHVYAVEIERRGAIAAGQSASAQQASSGVEAFRAACGNCHGPAMTGGTAPSILSYVRYHTDVEVSAAIRGRHSGAAVVPTDDSELRQILAGMRELAGTNPAMATGGFTGRRGGGPGPARGAGLAAPGRTAEIAMADGRSRTGILLAESETSAVLLENGRFTLLSRDGSVHHEKPVAPKADWTHYDGSLTGNRYTPLELINRTNVQRVGAAWVFPIAGNPRALQSTPVVQDGIMYVTGWNEIYALDGTTGRQIWTYSEERHDGILSEGGIGTNRGVTISGDRAFMVTDHAHLLGFNRFTGEKLWDVEMGSHLESYSATSPPLPVGDLLVVGVAGGEEGARGFLDAYRASTGERVWRWYSIPKRGEKGSETWVGQALEHGCGATWMPGSYDPQLDLIYWAIGNPCPDIAGEERIGDNLYTSSVVALAAKTGELKWYYQFSPHDTHDWDAVQPMLLVDEVWQGRPRKLLMHGDRNGMFYVLDRTNGDVLLTANLSSKVTWHKGFTRDGRPIVDPGSIATREGIAACPGGGGGANFQAASYNPVTRLFYARVSDSCAIYTSHEDPLGASGNRWFGRGAPGPKAREQLSELLKGYDTGVFIRAIDPFTGRKVWDLPAPAGRSGVLSSASGLIFLGGGGGLLVVDGKTGKPLWNVNIAQTTQGSPMTFMAGGKQYIALAGTSSITAYLLY